MPSSARNYLLYFQASTMPLIFRSLKFHILAVVCIQFIGCFFPSTKTKLSTITLSGKTLFPRGSVKAFAPVRSLLKGDHPRNRDSSLKIAREVYREYKSLKKKKQTKWNHTWRFFPKRKRLPSMEFQDDRNVDPTDQAELTNASRRQRIWGLARATRNTYLPRFSETVSQVATGVSNRAFGVDSADLYDEYGQLKLPKDATITLFSSYTTKTDGYYLTIVKGMLTCPGFTTRRSRLMFSLAKQVIKYGSEQAVNDLGNSQLSQDVYKFGANDDSQSDLDSLESGTSLILNGGAGFSKMTSRSSVNSYKEETEELMKSRLALFMARAIPNVQLLITVGSSETEAQDSKLATHTISTDKSGHFECQLKYKYKPSVVRVHAVSDESVFAFENIAFVSQVGLGIISDIDDTIKETGVTGDKRELLRKLLVSDMYLWLIAPVADWYNGFHTSKPISFHYVSNSPWEIFPMIKEYLEFANLPAGSIHLKQYSGNLISCLLESRSLRKRTVLDKILKDFPHKSFICIGDTGEQDLEAYVSLASSYPKNIKRIYLRVVKNSLSEVDEARVIREIRTLIERSNEQRAERFQNETRGNYIDQKAENVPDLIDLTEVTPIPKLPPKVPQKPLSLRGESIHKPALPRRPKPHPVIDQAPPAMERMRTDSALRSEPKVYQETKLDLTDGKGAEAIQRFVTALSILQNTDAEILLFTDDDPFFFTNSLEYVKDLEF